MTRSEREQLIRRYMSGEMPLAEEHDFFIQVALDKQLWLDLKAHQTVESAMMKDRVVEPSEIAMMGAQVTAMLAATHAGAGGGSSALPSQSAPAAATQGAAMIGGGAMKWLVTALCMTGLVAASAIIAPLLPPPVIPMLPASAGVETGARHPAPGPPVSNAPKASETPEPLPGTALREAVGTPQAREGTSGDQARRALTDATAGPRAAGTVPHRRAKLTSRQIPASRPVGDSIPLGARIRLSKPSGK